MYPRLFTIKASIIILNSFEDEPLLQNSASSNNDAS